MRGWLGRVLAESDGSPSASRFIMAVGLGVPIILATLVFFLTAFGILEWEKVAGIMEWLKDYVLLVILPYLGNKLSHFSKSFSSPGVEITADAADISFEEPQGSERVV